MESTRACQEASMTLASTPMVVQVRSPSVRVDEHPHDRAGGGGRVEHPDLVVGEVDAAERRVAAVERGPQRVVERVDRAVALADRDEALVARPRS